MKEQIEMENPKTGREVSAGDVSKGQEIDERFLAMEDFQRLHEEYRLKTKEHDEVRERILEILKNGVNMTPAKNIELDTLNSESAELNKELEIIHQQRSQAHKKSMGEEVNSSETISPKNIDKKIHPDDHYYPGIEN